MAIVIISAMLDVQAVTVRGPASCGSWIKERVKDGWPATANTNWLIGYLSGMVVYSRKDFIKGTDNDSLEAWVDNYCNANPLDSLDDAGIELAIELIRKKGL